MADADLTAPAVDGIAPALAAACERFGAAYSEWLAARSDLAARHKGDDASQEAESMRADRERTAELALIATPAPHATAVWRKWGFVEHLMSEEIDGGQSVYPAAVVALASLKADIFALGLKPWPDR
jgi:hypothetical protein